MTGILTAAMRPRGDRMGSRPDLTWLVAGRDGVVLDGDGYRHHVRRGRDWVRTDWHGLAHAPAGLFRAPSTAELRARYPNATGQELERGRLAAVRALSKRLSTRVLGGRPRTAPGVLREPRPAGPAPSWRL